MAARRRRLLITTSASSGFQVDLTNCEREPIHIPGAIQPHGVLLVLREPDLVIVHASENTGTALGAEADRLLGTSAGELLDTAGLSDLRDALGADNLAPLNPLRLGAGERSWDGILHRNAVGVVLELEPATEGTYRSVTGLYGQVRGALARLQSERSLPRLCDTMAREVRALTGFDRVMVYRFAPDWHGEVVAEDVAEGVDSFRGLHFPASDIPAQARELYRRNWLRLIADSDYQPARIVPDRGAPTGAPLDLSGSTLRSVSPIHLEYLRNMGVGASMSVSLLRDDVLWGLVACHHRAPRYVPFEVRAACEFLGQTFSVQLGTVVEDEDLGYALHIADVGARLVDRAVGAAEWARALIEGSPNLADVAGAVGAAVCVGGACHRVGATPTPDQIDALVHWLQGRETDVFATDNLAGVFPPASGYEASGLLAVAISRAGGEYLLWFRPEVVRTVEWAGNPEKAVQAADVPPAGANRHADADEVPRLHPRRSFAAWSETVWGHSLPWRPVEIRAAEALRGRLAEVVLRQAEALAQLNAELRRSNDELDAFTYIASHDLKEPLRGINSLTGFLIEDHAERLGPEGLEQAQTLVRLSRRMTGMLESLMEYARFGKMELRRTATDLQATLGEVLDTLATRVDESGVEVRVPRPLPTAECDPVRTGLIFQNLISNALKYHDKPDPWVEIGFTEPALTGGVTTFYVRDNGIGIDPRHSETVFRLFRRLHPPERFGGGSGAGLTIAHRLVERHGGRIWLESVPGEGTSFFFTLQPDGRGTP